jgi:aminoglycoside phosphotransferase (APT) family kinase protein
MPAAVVAPLAPFLRGELEPPAYGGPLRATHNDLHAEHLLLDPETLRPTGLIDWSDVKLGDPAVDFAGLWEWRGERFVRLALSHYDLPWDDAFLARCRFTAQVLGIAWVADVARSGDAAALARARAAFLAIA